jgi:two-component system sensor histidine kinase KdpD
VHVDPRLTSAALSHLIENAARYSAAGTTVAVQGTVTDTGLRVSVSDEGPGLQDEELERLFEPFVRGWAARRGSAGTGLGLAITRGLLAAEGGHVWAERIPGSGARFTLEVPAPRRAPVTQEA